MPVARHTIAIQQVQQVLQGARSRGVPVEPLLGRAGIAPVLLESRLARVSQQQYAQLLRVLRRATRDELWGLASRPLRPGSFALWARQLVACRTVGQALRLGFALCHQSIDDFTPRLVQAGGLAHVRIVQRMADDACSDYGAKAFMLFCFNFASWLAARRVPLVGVDYTLPQSGSESSRVYQAPIRFGQPHIGFWFESHWLELPVVQSEQSLREFLRAAPANLIVRYRDHSSVTERIRRLLQRRLGEELPPLDVVGQALGMSEQTLRRRLRDEGRGYQELKDALRRDAAIELLAARPDLTLVDVAARVGFSEASTFHRAFKKWTGVAPGEYRQRTGSPSTTQHAA